MFLNFVVPIMQKSGDCVWVSIVFRLNITLYLL